MGVKNSSKKLPCIIISTGGKNSIRFAGNFFKQTKVDYTRGKIINVYIVYALTLRIIDDYDDGENFVRVNGLFGYFNLSKTLDDTLKYTYHDGIGGFLMQGAHLHLKNLQMPEI